MDVLGLLEGKGFTLINVSGSEYKMQCINQSAHDDGEDTNWSLFVNIDKGVAFCQACGLKISETAMTKWLLGDDLDDFQLQALSLKGALKRIQNAEEPFLQEAEEFSMMPPSSVWDRDYRGISKEFLQSIGARYCKVGRYENRIIFPIYIYDRLRGFDSRDLGEKGASKLPKYLRSKGFNAIEDGLFPYDYVAALKSKYVILCEGVIDSINACEKGFPALCIFGLNFGPAKLALVLATGASEIIMMMDADSAGIAATAKITQEIKDWLTVSIADSSLLVDGKDLGDLNKEEIKYCIDNRRRVK